jgi:replicative DNA helicase
MSFEYEQEPHFSRYGKPFQEKIFQCLISDKEWAGQMYEVMQPTFFDVNYLEYLTERFFAYYNKYKCFPTLGLLVTIIKEDLNERSDIILRDQIINFLHRIKANPHLTDLAYVKDKTLDFCKKQAFKQALEDSVDLIQTENFDAVLTIMRKAVAVGMPSTVGHDFFEDAEARFVKINRQACPTGIPQLDSKDILNGGLGRGEIGVVVANTGVGKCVTGDAVITVRYMEVCIDGVRYKPWERVRSSQGFIDAINIGEGNVTYADRIEVLSIKSLFEQLGLDDSPEVSKSCPWPLEVLSYDDFYRIEALRTTEPLPTITVTATNGQHLTGAPNHRVMSMTHGTWRFLSEVCEGEQLLSGIHNPTNPKVETIEKNSQEVVMYDLQVETCHSFLTNGILSHNSHWLVAMGANAMRSGKNVLHYTFELTEYAVGLRYDSNLCAINSSEVQDRRQEILDKYADMDLGKLIIKEYPTGAASVITIRNHVEKLLLKGFVPSVIIIDYADIMKSTRSFDSLRHELKLVYEELRNLAMELNIPVWTASQANRDSANAEVVGLENMSEAYGKAMVADVVVSLSRKASEKAHGSGRLFVAKNRAGRDGLVYAINIDTSTSTFKVLDENALSLNEVVNQSESDMKETLRKKWKEINNGGTNESN